MKFKTNDLLLTIKRALPLIHPDKKSFLRRLWKITVKNSFGSLTDSLQVALELANSGYAKRHQEIKNFYQLLGVIKTLNYIDLLEEKLALRQARKRGNRKIQRPKIIPSSQCFIKTLKRLECEGKGKIVLLLLVMLSSGRRAVDIIRIQSNMVTPRDQSRYEVFIPFDKINFGSVRFIIDFRAIPKQWRPTSIAAMDNFFCAELRESNRPFKEIKIGNLCRSVKSFNPHALRSLLALHLTQLGMSDIRIMKIVGWKDSRSLGLYRRLDREEILGHDLGKLVESLNSVRS